MIPDMPIMTGSGSNRSCPTEKNSIFHGGFALILFILLYLAGCSTDRQKNITIHLAGDSTTADKPHPEINPERGWGQLLHEFFDERITVMNHAVNGRSTRSFISEGRWSQLLDQLEERDYVMIQFGHNDQKTYDPHRYANAWSAYSRNLIRMINDVREKGANPLYPSGVADFTHLNESGAREVAGMVARSINELDLPLASCLSEESMDPRVLLVTGGHHFDTTAFFELFHSISDVQFDTITHPHVRSLMASDHILSYDLLVLYDFLPHQPPGDSLLYQNLVHHGIPVLFLHHSICNIQSWNGFPELVGGRYVEAVYAVDSTQHSGYEHDLELEIEIVNRNHPVTRIMEDFTIHDEGYYNLQMEEGIEPLLVTDHPRCHPVVGWVNRYGRSTCVYLMLGHDRNAYENPSFRQLVENSIHWLSRDN